MKKKLFSIFFVFILFISISNIAEAATQQPNAETYLGSFNTTGTWYSTHCKAVQSTLKLRVDITSGAASYWVEYRQSSTSPWTSYSAVGKPISAVSSSTYTVSATKGFDYRVKLKENALFGSAKGTVVCY